MHRSATRCVPGAEIADAVARGLPPQPAASAGRAGAAAPVAPLVGRGRRRPWSSRRSSWPTTGRGDVVVRLYESRGGRASARADAPGFPWSRRPRPTCWSARCRTTRSRGRRRRSGCAAPVPDPDAPSGTRRGRPLTRRAAGRGARRRLRRPARPGSARPSRRRAARARARPAPPVTAADSTRSPVPPGTPRRFPFFPRGSRASPETPVFPRLPRGVLHS